MTTFPDGFTRTVYPDGSTEGRDLVEGYRRWDPAGALVEQRPLTSEEQTRMTPAGAERDSMTVTLEQQGRAAYEDNRAFITAAATVTFPLSVGSQQALVNQTVDLSKQVNALIRLAVANDMLD